MDKQKIIDAIKNLPAEMSEILIESEMAEYRTLIDFMDSNLKEMKENWERASIEFMKSANMSSFFYGEEKKYVLAVKKKDVFHRESILSALAYTQEQAEVLNTNCWLKSKICANPKTAGYYAQEVTDTLELKPFNPAFVKKQNQAKEAA